MNYIKEKPKCLNCKKPVPRRPNLYCSPQCHIEHKYKIYIERWLEGKETGNQSFGIRVSNYVKRWLKEIRGNKCEKCNWGKVNKISGTVPIEVNHIDGNSSNTVPENLELLCPNCHSLTSNYKALNKGNGRAYRRKS